MIMSLVINFQSLWTILSTITFYGNKTKFFMNFSGSPWRCVDAWYLLTEDYDTDLGSHIFSLRHFCFDKYKMGFAFHEVQVQLIMCQRLRLGASYR